MRYTVEEMESALLTGEPYIEGCVAYYQVASDTPEAFFEDEMTDYIRDLAREKGVSLREMQEMVFVGSPLSEAAIDAYFANWED